VILLAVVIIGVLVFFHELGHFLAAKAANMYVQEFALGMGPALISVQRGETKYSLRVLPVGGFLRVAGEEASAVGAAIPETRRYDKKTVLQRMIFVAGGSFMNFLLAALIFASIFMFVGVPSNQPVLGSVNEGWPAAQAGLQPGDRILRIGDAVRLALANKEALVASGRLLMEAVTRSGGELIPVDSEHSAIWQALRGWQVADVKRLILTASGGPFLGKSRSELAAITADDALKHPTWRMGRKITVDSATLMNKGLEIIEAHHLFGMPYERIETLVHPESIVHSLVEYFDGSQLAQCSRPDMRIPIQLALSYPERWPGEYVVNNWHGATWSFLPPDLETFRCLGLAIEAGKAGGSYPIALNAGNELAVLAFLEGRLPFLAIEAIVEEVLSADLPLPPASILDVMAVDTWARSRAQAIIRQKAVC